MEVIHKIMMELTRAEGRRKWLDVIRRDSLPQIVAGQVGWLNPPMEEDVAYRTALQRLMRSNMYSGAIWTVAAFGAPASDEICGTPSRNKARRGG